MSPEEISAILDQVSPPLLCVLASLRADGALKYEENGRARARAQLVRDERFHDAGWGTFHFTWREMYHEPAPTIDRLRRVFARNRPTRTSHTPPSAQKTSGQG